MPAQPFTMGWAGVFAHGYEWAVYGLSMGYMGAAAAAIQLSVPGNVRKKK
ncbi:hypothetical protein LI019_11640 [Enterocloster bolteae]|jgi:hypothetical protein|nr:MULTISPECIES: hypothetical protein [Clostridia]MCB7089588.1 hypothetical protein [Enterocloster bolteae]MCH1936485.1 hypothetical protein [Enterocloster sp. OA11]